MKNLLSILAILLVLPLYGQENPGTVDIDITTLPNDETYSPKHVLAIWVEDGSGAFVKTLKLRGDKRKEYLSTWTGVSSGNTTDAITGATLSSHQAHSLSWDCTDVSGAVVPDGTYTVMVEYTSAHKQGPLSEIEFSKAGDEVTVLPPDETYFKDMQLVYTPDQTSRINPKVVAADIRIYPVPAREQLFISLDLPTTNTISIDLYSIDMKLIDRVFSGKLEAGKQVVAQPINTGQAIPGTYILLIRGENLFVSRQVSLE